MAQYQSAGMEKRGFLYRCANTISKPAAFALASWGGSEAYRGITENGFSDWAGGGIDKVNWLSSTLSGIGGVEDKITGFVGKAPYVGEYLDGFVDFVMPTDGAELAALTSLAIAGGLLVNQGVKFGKDPLGYIGRVKRAVKDKLGEYASVVRDPNGSSYSPHPIQATKKAARYVWNTARHAWINIPALMLNNYVAGGLGKTGEALGKGTKLALDNSGTIDGVGNVMEYLSNLHVTLDIITPTREQLADLGACFAAATPWIVAGSAAAIGGKLAQRYTDRKIREGIDAAGAVAKEQIETPDA